MPRTVHWSWRYHFWITLNSKISSTSIAHLLKLWDFPPCDVAFMHNTTLHCPVLHCNEIHCTAQHCSEEYCKLLHFTALHCNILHCTEICNTALGGTALLFTARPCFALYCHVLPGTLLHCNTLKMEISKSQESVWISSHGHN